jgi:hypothetical protein
MFRGWRWIAVASVACVLLGCHKKQAATDAGPDDAAVAAAETGPAPLASNEASVTRYPDESAINNMPQTTRWTVANVRTQASNTAGDMVAALKSGTEVTKIAEEKTFFLVTFPDPNDASKKDMGWVSQAVFTPEPAHKHVPLHCTGGQVPILLQVGEETCMTTCTQDSNCPKGNVCNGAGVLSNNGAPGASTKFCGPSAGPATPTTADAGAPPAKKLLDVKPEGGKCPAGYGQCGVMCRYQCAKDADCPVSPAHCQAGFCLGQGATPCAK